MGILTDSLRSETFNIKLAIAELDIICRDPSPALLPDIRTLCFALRLLLKSSHLQKIETVLVPSMSEKLDESSQSFRGELEISAAYNELFRFQLAKLQFEIDSCDANHSAELKHVILRAQDLSGTVKRLIDNEYYNLFELADHNLSSDEQSRLFLETQKIDQEQGFERIRGTQVLLGRIQAS